MLRRIVLLAALATTTPAWAQTLSRTLPNGLKVIVKEDRRAPVAVSQLWYKVGSIDEKEGKTGLSHALEHMMFKGTPAVPSGEFSRRVSALGGQNNAYTNRYETVYYENVAAANLPEVLKMEADRMANLNFSDKEFINEMNVIREERRQRTDDSPFGKLWEHVFLNSYRTPALRAPVIGYMNDLHTLKADDLRQWYKQWYAPNNATLVIVGDVNAKQTLKTAENLFGNIPAKTLPPRNRINETAERAPVSAETTSAVTRQPVIALSYRVPKLEKTTDKLPYALDVLSDILGGNSSSRLDKNLVRGKQLALDIGVNYDMFSRNMALFSIVAMPAEGTDDKALLESIRSEIKNIADNGISQSELERVHRLSAASEIYAKDSMTSQASLLGQLETRGFKYSDEAEIRRRLQKVSAADVQAAAKLLTPQRSSVVVVRPEVAAAK
ncbi:M16 family metallopeptidase [Neisseria zoodegmatis]|uniref:Peptidase M16 n=1 Tax=Neisseria zoodegmatis TaxID=326523 RepID=A0AB38DNA8_9NEIS|nr:pitrilysin family protein [Neisseria zoodegmatis]OSI09604.1 peptidase M16 [Neisseria zoodegmatis]SNU78873.1 Protease 3 precursor [Neisseria zoodegmatis]